MSNDMLGKLVKLIVCLPVEVIGTLYDLVEKLGGKEGAVWLTGLKRFLRKENSWEQPLFKYDKTKNGWTILEDAPFDGREFVPEFVEFLRPGESSVNGDVMKLRARELNIHTGQGHAEYLLEHRDKIPKELQGRCLVFPETVWQTLDGRWFIPCLDWYGGRCYLCFGQIKDGWDYSHCLVRSRK